MGIASPENLKVAHSLVIGWETLLTRVPCLGHRNGLALG